jgi:hypothetical protein
VPAGAVDAPRAVVLRGGMVLPALDELCVVGATLTWKTRIRRRGWKATRATSSAPPAFFPDSRSTGIGPGPRRVSRRCA